MTPKRPQLQIHNKRLHWATLNTNFTSLLLTLLIILISIPSCVNAEPSFHGYFTLGRRSSFVERGIRFPCAWLERDGFFDPRNNFVSKTPFVQSRSQCVGKGHCYMNWLPINSAHAITFKLIGTDESTGNVINEYLPHCTL
ncbi:hypothetical protein ACTXT7_005316 [Hymenolepis weldensis]